MGYLRLLFLMLLLVPLTAKGTGTHDNRPSNAASAGMGDATVMRTNFWAVFHNQAGLGFLKQKGVGVHFENAYMLKELSQKAVGFVLPVRGGTFGITYNQFGYENFSKTKAGLAFGKQLGERIAVGIQLDYLRTHIGDVYGDRHSVTGEIGVISEPLDGFFVGAHVFNPVRAQLSEYDDERLPTVFRLGLGYAFSNQLFVSAEAEKDLEYAPLLKVGVEYEIVDNLMLRAGITTNPALFSFGIGYTWKNITLDFAVSKHQILDYTPYSSMHYAF